ncbi:MAG: exodeoxyribonuclease VII small subunit [Omnitrophica WOR_2 bacterium RIFCSPLOWO2_12_FULL_46_30]|nr:MAG: exodeoxyribonuclease VII small subunit [Omnitrophica WOR_2 bacterium RIFCSPLOWO2_12_FULL_46_30]
MAEVRFEEALKKLEKIVSDLEAGKLSLDESLKKYEEGVRLVAACSKLLEQAQKKVEVLTKKEGTFQLKPFEEEQPEDK